MSEQPADGTELEETQEQDHAGRDPMDGEGEGKGIELTLGEPNSFEPEEDPDATSGSEHP
jgi:hypothetical protein